MVRISGAAESGVIVRQSTGPLRAGMTQFPRDSRVPVSSNRKGGTVKGIANAVVSHAVVLMALTATASAQPPVLIGFEEKETRFAVRRAVEQAAARLADPHCQEVLSDFADESGQPLGVKLQASGRTPAQALRVLRFFDDGMAPQCQAGTVMAFTHPGSGVIRVCGRQFRDRDPEAATIIVIHEFLHALGLGENPPTSHEITARVAARCAR
jgi:hypothetical protein